MKLLRFLLPLLVLPSIVKAAAPTFGQVMWTNNTALVILSPERETNRIQLTTNLVTFGGVSSGFPALWREGTIVHVRVADNSAFGTLNAGLIESRTGGIIMDTEDSATPFAYSFLLRKKGDVGNTNSTIALGAELGNVTWQGWDGASYIAGASIVPKTEQAWSGAGIGVHMEFRLVPSNAVSGTEIMRLAFASGVGGGPTNGMLLLNGTSDSFPALKRFGRQMQIRSADNTGFADFVASNAFFAGPVSITGQLNLINNVPYTWPAANANGILTNDGAGNLGVLAASALAGPWLTSNTVIAPTSVSFPGLRQGIVSGSESWNPTNVGFGSIGFGSNNTAGGYFSSVLGGGSNSIATNSQFSAIVGGERNTINQAAGGHNFIGAGWSNIITAASSNSVIGGGFGNIIMGNVKGSTIAGGFSNRVENLGGTIGGGFGNYTGGQASTAAGGQNNVAGNTVNADWISIIGGRGNQANPDYGTIGGGETNFIQNNATYGFIGGGHGNDVNSDIANVPGGSKNIININSHSSFILGGTSNNIATSVPGGGAIGNFGTNAQPYSLLLSPRGTHGSNQLHVSATASTNLGPLYVRAGWSTTHGRVGGVLTNNTTFRTNHSGAGTFTNLQTYIVPAGALSNTSDTVIFYLRGNFQFASATTNDFRCVYGTATVFDTGFITASNCTWESWIEVTRTGNSSQLIGSKVNWIVNGTAGAGNQGALSIWATNAVHAQNNGITNIFAFQAASRTAATITNDLFKVTWEGYPNF